MALNPIRFGTDVVNQFGRYLRTTFPIADDRLSAQVEEALKHHVAGEPLLYRGPYVTLSRAFEQGPTIHEVIDELGLHPALAGVFPFESLHKHQELALQAIVEGWNTILSTGTGSGKTEGFLLPILNHCLNLRDQKEPMGVVAVLVYPMNALVNDQLERLRTVLAGTQITFGRYTGETPERAGDDLSQLDQPRPYTQNELRAYEEEGQPLPHPWEECFDRISIRERQPRLLLTNYAQLEYLLLQDKDLGLFRDAPLHFLVFDEVHTYTGELGSEVACLIRRLRDVANKRADEVVCIGTSATVTDEVHELNGEEATLRFAHRLFGVPQDSITFITEHYRPTEEPVDLYTPPPPADSYGLFGAILETAAEVHRRDEPGEPPVALLELAEELCGQPAPTEGSVTERLYDLLASNRLARRLEHLLTRPVLLEEALLPLRQLDGHEGIDDGALVAEVMATLTLGAIAERDGEPLLRPKLHYFIQGFQGLYVSFEDEGLHLHFDFDTGQAHADGLLFPLLLCRSCGQHFSKVAAAEEEAAEAGGRVAGYRPVRILEGFEEPGDGESLVFFTDYLHTQEEDEEPSNVMYLCRFCGSIHPESEQRCLSIECQRQDSLVEVLVWNGEPSRCPACGGQNWGNVRLITHTRSAEVADVSILSQSMLAAMPEPTLQKLLIFADNRQDAAFQAGWMEERSKRFRMRHLLYRLLNSDPERTWGYERLVEDLLAEAQAQQIVRSGGWDADDERTRVRWFVLEEFASPSQRRSSLEQLGLAVARYKDLEVGTDADFFERWATTFGCDLQGVVDVVQILLDHYRRRGLLSDSLLSRYWSPQDVEVRKGLVATADYYRPFALVREGASQSTHAKGWMASNGRSAAQVIVKKSVPRGQAESDHFLTALWAWLIDHEYLVEVELVQRRYGRIERIPLPGETYQVNVERLGITETGARWVCSHCHRAHSVTTPTGACAEYTCEGNLQPSPRDVDHYDVVQYTQLSFVPMKANEHSAQVPKEDRERIEREFKKENGRYNTIVATPTLELGVDIGRLEMVLMRNVPPSPANYAQRSGRAGRRHRIAVVFTYARGAHHDRYFLSAPPEIIAGHIRVPTFSMRNEPLVRKHVHSAALTALRQLVRDGEVEVLRRAFPEYISSYFGEWVSDGDQDRFRFLDTPPAFPDLAELIHRHRDPIIDRLERTFAQTWPADEAEAVTRERLGAYLNDMPAGLERHVGLLFAEIKRYRDALAGYAQTEQAGYSLSSEEESQRRRFQSALSTYRRETLENWTLGYLSNRGFLPGYSLGRESVLAQSLQPFLQLFRPAAIALRELTPGNFVYANRRVFQVKRLNFYKLRAQDSEWTSDQLRRQLRFDFAHQRVFDPASQLREGGDTTAMSFESYQLTDVEMELEQGIDDRREYRQRMAFNIYGMLLDQHDGGRGGRIGDRQFRILHQETVRLVNLGPTRTGPASPGIGFPICPHCGEARPPRASEAEIQSFREAHQRRCQVRDILWTAIHVEIPSDVLLLGPYENEIEAVNVFEGVRIGARMVLDMGENEIEGFPLPDESGQVWAVLYDPLPGGSGFLPEILRYWPQVCDQALPVLAACTCDKACYKCMKHFRNQQYHGHYDRHLSAELLAQLVATPAYEHEIPPVVAPQESSLVDQAESPAEENLLMVLERNNFPLPNEAQYRVDLGAGEFTVADHAYTDENVLVFVDGLSEALHGDPAHSQQDRLRRAKARMRGYQIVEISAAGLHDQMMINAFLEELALYLNKAATAE